MLGKWRVTGNVAPVGGCAAEQRTGNGCPCSTKWCLHSHTYSPPQGSNVCSEVIHHVGASGERDSVHHSKGLSHLESCPTNTRDQGRPSSAVVAVDVYIHGFIVTLILLFPVTFPLLFAVKLCNSSSAIHCNSSTISCCSSSCFVSRLLLYDQAAPAKGVCLLSVSLGQTSHLVPPVPGSALPHRSLPSTYKCLP